MQEDEPPAGSLARYQPQQRAAMIDDEHLAVGVLPEGDDLAAGFEQWLWRLDGAVAEQRVDGADAPGAVVGEQVATRELIDRTRAE